MPSKNKKDKELARITEAVEYRIQGHDYSQIAEQMNCPQEEAVELVSKGLAALHREPLKERILLDLKAIETMLAQTMPNAATGEPQAISITLQLIDRRTKLEAQLVPSTKQEAFFHAIKGKLGRAPHQPTDKTKAIVEAMVLNGIPKNRIAEHIGIDVGTLTRHYEHILDFGVEAINSEAAATLVNHWRRGNLSALIFHLKTKGGFKEVQAHELSGPDGTPLPAPSSPLNLPLVQFFFSDDGSQDEPPKPEG